MCLILLAWHALPDHPLIVAANRDEFYVRPTRRAQFWPEAPDLLAGKDLQAGGSWMGVTRSGRFAALTNFREPDAGPHDDTLSRGRLVSDFLDSTVQPLDYLADVAGNAGEYRAFNLICGSLDHGLWHFSNRSPLLAPEPVAPGVHGLSNNLLNISWPKVTQGKTAMRQALTALPDTAPLFALLSDPTTYDESRLPRTGINLDWERILSAAFICSAHYGTRSSTVLTIDSDGTVNFDEKTFTSGIKDAIGDTRRRFRFNLGARQGNTD